MKKKTVQGSKEKREEFPLWISFSTTRKQWTKMIIIIWLWFETDKNFVNKVHFFSRVCVCAWFGKIVYYFVYIRLVILSDNFWLSFKLHIQFGWIDKTTGTRVQVILVSFCFQSSQHSAQSVFAFCIGIVNQDCSVYFKRMSLSLFFAFICS